MALKVDNTPTYNGTLKVVNNYPTATVKVVQNYGTQTPNYNPQKTVNPQPQAGAKYVQSTATPKQINQAQVQAQWAQQQAEALRQEQERLAYEKLQRVNTFKSNVDVKTNDWKAKVAGAVGLGGVLAQWRKRNGAGALSYDLNGSANDIEGARRYLEREMSKRIAEFEKNPTQENYNNLLAWSNQQDQWFGSTIKNFNVANATISDQYNAPFKGKASNFGRTVTALVNTVGAPAKVAWNAGMWAINQPSRLINTAKNYVNPNNLRQYYDGTELKGGSRSLRWAYNASKDQRIVGRSKADEQAQLEQLRQSMARQNGGTNIFGTSTTSGFLRGGSLDRFRIKYGDDLANLALDPVNWIGAGTSVKARTLLGNSKVGTRLSELLKTAKNRFTPSLFSEYISPSEKMYKLGQMLNASKRAYTAKAITNNDKANELLKSIQSYFDNVSTYKVAKRGLGKLDKQVKSIDVSSLPKVLDTSYRHGFFADIQNKSDLHKAIFIRAVKNNFRITPTDMLRYVGKNNRKMIGLVKKDLQDYKSISGAWHKADGTPYRKGYLPSVVTGTYDPRMARNGKGFLQPQDLELALKNREMMSNLGLISGKARDLHLRSLKKLQGLYGTVSDLQKMQKSSMYAMATELGISIKGLTKKKAWDQLAGHSGNNIGMYKSLRRDARLATQDKRLVQQNYDRYIAKLTPEKNKKRLIGAPNAIWKSAVTALTPGWYLNNAITNEIVGGSAGGWRFFAEQLKHLNPLGKSARLAEKGTLPKELYSNVAEGLGLHTVGRFGSKVENSARIPLFKALKKQGLSDNQALKVVNEHLFDYKTRNIDRPIKTLLPFWLWSKGLTKLGGTMWYKNPRGMSGFNILNRKLEQDYNQAQSSNSSYVDDATGQTVTVDRKDKLKGKLKIGKNTWLDTNWLPFTPDRASQFGVSPYVSATGELLSGENKFGKNTSLLKTFSDRTSATRLIEATFRGTGIKKWFSANGYGKEQQGADPTAPNYNKYLDNKPDRTRAIKSFFGVPGVTKYDPNEFTFRNNMQAFNTEFFATNWDKLKQENYADAIQKQKDMAKKYGLTWDQVEQDWGKYDTATSKNTKALKQQSYSDLAQFWNDWYPKKGNARNDVVRSYYAKSDANPYRKFPVLKGNDKIAGTADDKLLSPKTIRDSHAVQVNGKWFKSQASADRYFGAKRTAVNVNGKWFKTADSARKYTEAQAKKDFWNKYWGTTDKNERLAMLNANPQYKKVDLPTTKEGWDLFKAKNKADKQARMRTLAGFNIIEARTKTLTVAPLKFNRQKKIAFKL